MRELSWAPSGNAKWLGRSGPGGAVGQQEDIRLKWKGRDPGTHGPGNHGDGDAPVKSYCRDLSKGRP